MPRLPGIMQIVRLVTILFVCLVLAFEAGAQVSVSQSFVDDANAAFREVVVLRSANEALGKANTANAQAVEALKEVNTLLKADNADLRKLKCDKVSVFFVISWKRCK
jgi:hypothetical protein